MRLKYPEMIGPGDRIGIVAPASPFDRGRFHRGVEMLRRMGFEPVFTERVFYKNRYFAGDSADRARDIHEFFAAPDIKALWAVRGGYGSLRILSELDYEAISRTPKIFIGCSDITALLAVFYFRCAITVFHGPMIVSLAEADDDTLESLVNALGKTRPVDVRAGHGRVIREGRATGPVLGGNLATLCHLLATPYTPDFTGCILFLEDTGEKPYRIDRMLTQMMLAGCFENIAGIAAGSFRDCGTPGEIDRIFSDVFSGGRFPVIAGFPAGHGNPNMTLPLGVCATIDTSSLSLTYQESAVLSPGGREGAAGR